MRTIEVIIYSPSGEELVYKGVTNLEYYYNPLHIEFTTPAKDKILVVGLPYIIVGERR